MVEWPCDGRTGLSCYAAECVFVPFSSFLLISFALIFFSKNDRNLLFGSPPNPLQSCSGSDCQNNRAWSGLGGADKVQNNCPRLKGLVPEFLRYRCLDTYELLNKS